MASWPFYFRPDSSEFFNSLLVLFRLIKEKKIKKIFLESSTPGGGTLTLETIAFLEQQVSVYRPLEKVALLESLDFHWDNNMVQFFNYLILTFKLDVQFRLFACKDEAIGWLQQT